MTNSNFTNKLSIVFAGFVASQLFLSLPAQAVVNNKPETHQVPEPLTILGVGAALASLPKFKKYYNKRNNDEK